MTFAFVGLGFRSRRIGNLVSKYVRAHIRGIPYGDCKGPILSWSRSQVMYYHRFYAFAATWGWIGLGLKSSVDSFQLRWTCSNRHLPSSSTLAADTSVSFVEPVPLTCSSRQLPSSSTLPLKLVSRGTVTPGLL
uniref:Uncharacterized protein n=1 Tax=Solanum tuberosum TaxID=4113 RepID=M1DWC6_SOLTU